jgi:hypothetical protein
VCTKLATKLFKTYDNTQHGGMNIRRVRIVAKSSCYLRHVHLSVRRLSDFLRVSAQLLLEVKDKTYHIQACTGPEGSRRLRFPEILDSRHMNVVKLSALHTGHLHPQENSSALISVRT